MRVIAAQGALALAAGCYFARNKLLPTDDGSARTTGAAASDDISAEKVLKAADSIVKAARSYGFVCTNYGRAPPECRIMDTHWLSGTSLEVALVSRTFTRKAESLKGNPECTVCYHDPRASGENGYLSLTGRVRALTADAAEQQGKWKGRWSFFHPTGANVSSDVVVWHFIPSRIEIVSHNHLLTDDWAPVTMHRRTDVTRPASETTGPAGGSSSSSWVLQARGRSREEPGHRLPRDKNHKSTT